MAEFLNIRPHIYNAASGGKFTVFKVLKIINVERFSFISKNQSGDLVKGYAGTAEQGGRRKGTCPPIFVKF